MTSPYQADGVAVAGLRSLKEHTTVLLVAAVFQNKVTDTNLPPADIHILTRFAQDHHCPWLGSRCIGHRTYPAFIHFIASITLLSCYVAGVSISALMFALDHSSTIVSTKKKITVP